MESGFVYLSPYPDSDSDGGYNHVTLPDGRTACYRHLRIVCDKCCLDFSAMEPQEISDDDDYEDEEEEEEDDDNEIGGLVSVDYFMSACTVTKAKEEKEDDNNGIVGLRSVDYFYDCIYREEVGGDARSYDLSRFRRGTGKIFATRFTPPSANSTPNTVFRGIPTYGNITRYVHRRDHRIFLVYTDGACLNNGQPNPKAGWAFVHGPSKASELGDQPARCVSGRLENKGPFGDKANQTSNRAELRAVIQALRFRYWPGEWATTPNEPFRKMVIATDSEYVVEGATNWVRHWLRNGWKKADGSDVKNKDLWECLLGEIETLNEPRGLTVEFWRIPRELNVIADAVAKKAARDIEVNEFCDVLGTLF